LIYWAVLRAAPMVETAAAAAAPTAAALPLTAHLSADSLHKRTSQGTLQ